VRDKAPKLAMLIKRLLIAIKNAEKAIHSQNEAITQATKAANAKQSIPPLVRAEVNLPDGIETHKRATDAADDKKYRFWTLLVSWLTFIAVVVYAGFWQYGEITYRDIFNKTLTHWVKFCYYRIVANGQAHWVTCNAGNDIDREEGQNPN